MRIFFLILTNLFLLLAFGFFGYDIYSWMRLGEWEWYTVISFVEDFNIMPNASYWEDNWIGLSSIPIVIPVTVIALLLSLVRTRRKARM